MAVFFAAAGAALWAAKSVAIGTAGGLGRSPAEDPLFFLGLGASLVAVTCLILAWTWGWSRRVRLLAALAGLPLVFLLTVAIQAVVRLVEPDEPGWPWAEINLWVVAAVVLGLAVAVRRRTGWDERVTRSPHTPG